MGDHIGIGVVGQHLKTAAWVALLVEDVRPTLFDLANKGWVIAILK